MFANAKTLKTATKSKKAEVETVKLAGLEQLGAIDAVMKALTALRATVEMDVKSGMTAEFIKRGMAKQTRPENFKGEEGIATASCQLKKRSSTSPLSDSEIELLTEAKISVETVDLVAETFVINPAYKDDQVLLGKIEKKLSTIKDLPEDFIMKQAGVSRTIVGETALDEVFAFDSADMIAQFLPMVSSLAIKPTLNEDDVSKAFEIVSKIMEVPDAV